MTKSKENISDNHWIMKDYKERISVKAWKEILLNNEDTIIYRGNLVHLKAKRLGYGVVEISKVFEED